MDVEGLLKHLGIPYATAGQSANVGRQWVGVRCPFCSDHSDHLGINTESGACKCWRCGGHRLDAVLGKLTGFDDRRVHELMKRYGTRRRRQSSAAEPVVRTVAFKLPSGTGALTDKHKRYLSQRGFDPEELEQEWGVQGTGPVSFLDGASYGHRIVIPIHWQGEVVSFQARDITGRAELRYKACPQTRERRPYKTTLYGQEQHWRRDCGICVEGITDVWRLGPLACATFGTTVTREQIKALARAFDRVAVVFDGGEVPAARAADELVDRLRGLHVQARRVDIEGDPADLDAEAARELVRDLRRDTSIGAL